MIPTKGWRTVTISLAHLLFTLLYLFCKIKYAVNMLRCMTLAVEVHQILHKSEYLVCLFVCLLPSDF